MKRMECKPTPLITIATVLYHVPLTEERKKFCLNGFGVCVYVSICVHVWERIIQSKCVLRIISRKKTAFGQQMFTVRRKIETRKKQPLGKSVFCDLLHNREKSSPTCFIYKCVATSINYHLRQPRQCIYLFCNSFLYSSFPLFRQIISGFLNLLLSKLLSLSAVPPSSFYCAFMWLWGSLDHFES